MPPRIRRSRRFRGRAAGEDDEECPVCRETYDDQVVRRVFPAVCPQGHTVCESCWQNPLMETRCPVCRAIVTPPNVSRRRQRTVDDIEREAMALRTHPNWQIDDMTLLLEEDSEEDLIILYLARRIIERLHSVLVSLHRLILTRPELLNFLNNQQRDDANIDIHFMIRRLAYLLSFLNGDDVDYGVINSAIHDIYNFGSNLHSYIFLIAINNDIRHLVEEFVIAFQRFNENFHNILDDDDDAEDRE